MPMFIGQDEIYYFKELQKRNTSVVFLKSAELKRDQPAEQATAIKPGA